MDNEPWLTEPDDHLFESHGYVCHAVRYEPLGHWCGYIYVPEGHPLYGVAYDDDELTVHGGLTYSDTEDGATRFGFDCGHYMDLVPARAEMHKKLGLTIDTDEERGTYKTLEFVINELDNLAKQIKEREQ